MAATTAFQRALLVCELQKSHAGATDADLAYVDPRKTPVPAGLMPTGQPWNGFPLAIKQLCPNDPEAQWKKAEDLHAHRLQTGSGKQVLLPFRAHQDEYLEWHADADDHGVWRVSFTCEGPEYWSRMAEVDFDRVHELYCDHVDPDIPKDDLCFAEAVLDARGEEKHAAGSYNPFNRWNTTDGAMHLTHPANTLGAEINLAARATVGRLDAEGKPVSDKLELICCARYGSASRDSDPSIGQTANAVVRQGKTLTLTDPIGLYMASFDAEAITLTDGAEVADGTRPDTWWKCVRGEERSEDGGVRMLRIEYRIPADATMPNGAGGRRPLRLADLEVNATRATRAGALAELVGMHLYVTAWDDPAVGDPLKLYCCATCCRTRDGLLDHCQAPGAAAEYPKLWSAEHHARMCDKAEEDRLWDEVYLPTYEEALTEAQGALEGRRDLDVAGFGAETVEEEPDAAGLAAFVTATRA